MTSAIDNDFWLRMITLIQTLTTSKYEELAGTGVPVEVELPQLGLAGARVQRKLAL